MNGLHIGRERELSIPPGGVLYIGEEFPDAENIREFDVKQDRFDPYYMLDYLRISEQVDIFDAAFPRGNGTLTKDMGLECIADLLQETGSLDMEKPRKGASPGELWAYSKLQRLRRSPLIQRVFSGKKLLKDGSRTAVRLNRAEIGDFDALFLGLVFVSSWKEQVVISDLGFWGIDAHIALVRQERLICGIDSLFDVSEKLRRNLLSIENKIARNVSFEDAKLLAEYKHLRPDREREDNAYNRFIEEVMS